MTPRRGGVPFDWSSVDDLLSELHRRSRATLRDRWNRVKASLIVAAQAGVAAALAWVIANDLLRHPHPFFAPIAAVITLGVSFGQRYRRAAELVIGVALGIAVGDGLIYLIGTGGWQIGLVVALAVVSAVFVGGTAALVTQAASSAVLVATLAPPSTGIYYTRFLDALIGGGIALGVMALLLPANPLTVVSRAAGPALGVLVDGLTDTAAALEAGDERRANAVLIRISEGHEKLATFQATLPEGREMTTIAPIRWRARSALAQYVEAADHIERAVHNGRVLVRRSVTLLRDGESVSDKIPVALRTLAGATAELRRELAAGANPDKTSDLAVRAVVEAGEAYRDGVGFSGGVIVAQIRAIATDLLGAAGLKHSEAVRLIRKAGGKLTP